MSLGVPLYGFGGGGGSGSGGVLVVTAPAGVTVTVSKDDKSYTKTAAGGTATFKGLKTGTWTVTITDGSQTATQSVYVGTDYAITMAFFMATISVTYPEGSICTCSDGATTLTAPDTSGSHTFTVNSAGDWTVTITDGEETKTETVTITEDGQSESITIGYELWVFDGANGVDNTGGFTVTTTGQSSYTVSDTIYVNAYGQGGTYEGTITMVTKETYDLSGYSLLEVDVSAWNRYAGYGDGMTLYVCDSSGAELASVALSAVNTFTIDVSNINEECTLKIYGYAREQGNDGYLRVNIASIVLR